MHTHAVFHYDCMRVHLWIMNPKYQRWTQETRYTVHTRCPVYVCVSPWPQSVHTQMCVCVCRTILTAILFFFPGSTFFPHCCVSRLWGPLSVFVASGVIMIVCVHHDFHWHIFPSFFGLPYCFVLHWFIRLSLCRYLCVKWQCFMGVTVCVTECKAAHYSLDDYFCV